ncbi:MAG: hypothetical protein NTW50_00635, partial [Candidatus Berkelbacteria bacterium]|nr:hypothetical protein [Candidatus Berkelbacteria bacterium]
MNCQEITSKMDDISKEMYRFDVNIRKTPIDVGGIMKSRELVTLITNEILKSFDPALMIIKKLKDPATWEEFDSQVNIGESNRKRWISYPAGRKLPEDIFAEFSYYGPIKSESFAELVKFLDSIKVWLLNHLEALAKNYDVETDRTVYNRNQILRSICETFLNKTMRENSIISVSNLPEEIVSYDFAKNLKCGRIEIDQCGYGLGREMTGGEIFATNAGGQAGSGMQGGKIVIYGQTGGETGTGMEGGKIYVNKHIIDPKDRDSDWPFGYESKHGTLIAKYDNVRAAGVNGGADIFIDESASYGIGERKEEGVIIANKAGNILSRGREKTTHKMFGTLYAGQYTDTAPERSEIETFTFDHQLGQYIDLRQKQNAPIV